MARNTYGLDLGSYEIKVYDKKQDTIWKEKNVLAVQDKKEIIAIGEDAYQMYEILHRILKLHFQCVTALFPVSMICRIYLRIF